MSSIEMFENMLHIVFDDREKDYIRLTVKEVRFAKGEIPVLEGNIMDSFFFIVKGIVRGYYLDQDGNEVTKCFSSENQFFSSECFRTNLPSSFNVECIEDCQCIRVPYLTVKAIDKVEEKINYLYVKEIQRLEKRVHNMLMMNAQERYCNFCNEYKGVCNRIPLKYVASYIGINPASLSRIRHKYDMN